MTGNDSIYSAFIWELLLDSDLTSNVNARCALFGLATATNSMTSMRRSPPHLRASIAAELESASGTAGSLVVVLINVHNSAQIVLFGAELARSPCSCGLIGLDPEDLPSGGTSHDTSAFQGRGGLLNQRELPRVIAASSSAK